MAPTDLRFRFGLARELGMTVGELDQMSLDELDHWKAFYALEREEIEHERKRKGG